MLTRKRLKTVKIIGWKPILCDDYLRTEFNLDTFIIGDVKDKKQISKLIQYLQETYPLPDNLKFKRIKNDKSLDSYQILISHKQNYKGLAHEFNSVESSSREMQLPIDRVFTRKQYEIVSKYWPLQFHIDKRIESLLDMSFERNEENLMIRSDFYTRLVVDLAIHYKLPSAALIVDAKKDRIVGSGNYF